MKAFFTDDQLLHDPQQFMRLGRIAKPTDLPSRAHALRDALAGDRKSTRLNSSHIQKSRMPSSA